MAVSKRVPGPPAVHNAPKLSSTVQTDGPVLADLVAGASMGPGAVSPARDLQESLTRSLQAVPSQITAGGRWSPRRTLSFLLVTNGAFWLTAVWLALRLF